MPFVGTWRSRVVQERPEEAEADTDAQGSQHDSKLTVGRMMSVACRVQGEGLERRARINVFWIMRIRLDVRGVGLFKVQAAAEWTEPYGAVWQLAPYGEVVGECDREQCSRS